MTVYMTNVTVETRYYVLIFKMECRIVITYYFITQYMNLFFAEKKLHLIKYKLFEKKWSL